MPQGLICTTAQDYVPYMKAVSYMEDYVNQMHQDSIAEKIWFLEHQDIYTAGVSSSDADILNNNISIVRTGRGGKLTYHGIGMRIIYIMLNLKQRNLCDVRKYIFNLEEIIINSLKYFSVIGERRKDRVGIWVKNGANKEDKIAAIGVRIRKWITFHGVAINVNPDLNKFNNIIPCGIKDSNYGITSLAKLGVDIEMQEFDIVFKQEFFKIFPNL